MVLSCLQVPAGFQSVAAAAAAVAAAGAVGAPAAAQPCRPGRESGWLPPAPCRALAHYIAQHSWGRQSCLASAQAQSSVTVWTGCCLVLALSLSSQNVMKIHDFQRLRLSGLANYQSVSTELLNFSLEYFAPHGRDSQPMPELCCSPLCPAQADHSLIHTDLACIMQVLAGEQGKFLPSSKRHIGVAQTSSLHLNTKRNCTATIL